MSDVLCAGILVADTFCGPLDALPAEGQLLALDAMLSRAGGCAANVAISLAKQGIPSDVLGCVGNDPSAQIILSSLNEKGIGCEHISYSTAQPTSQTVVLLVRGQDRRYIHVFGANKEFTVSAIDRSWLNGIKVFYLGGLYAMPGIDTVALRDLLRFCRENQIITMLDVVVPKDQHDFDGLFNLLPFVDYFVPNDDESHQITGLVDPLEQIRFYQRCGANTVVITQGGEGCLAAVGKQVWHCGSFAVPSIDFSGSGDAFSAGLITGILHGWDLPRQLQYASALGASATRAIGTTDGVFTRSEAEAYVKATTLAIRTEKL